MKLSCQDPSVCGSELTIQQVVCAVGKSARWWRQAAQSSPTALADRR
ncbi:MAG: hypothetical protein ACLU38_14925 [Dysosmobacter sp.]